MGRHGAFAAVAVGVALVASPSAPTAVASPANWGMNGTYAATSLGDWAKTNERYQDEPIVRSTWTIATTCTSPISCVGTVTSDQGWSAPMSTTTGLWYVNRTLPGWQPCADGTASDAAQMFRFYPVDSNGTGMANSRSTTYSGEDITKGSSGACGINQWLVIRMPFKLDKI